MDAHTHTGTYKKGVKKTNPKSDFMFHHVFKFNHVDTSIVVLDEHRTAKALRLLFCRLMIQLNWSFGSFHANYNDLKLSESVGSLKLEIKQVQFNRSSRWDKFQFRRMNSRRQTRRGRNYSERRTRKRFVLWRLERHEQKTVTAQSRQRK